MGLGADQIFAAALDVDLGDGLIVIVALVDIIFLLIITLGVWMVRAIPSPPATNDE